MIYIFEDDPSTLLPTLFQSVYIGSNNDIRYSEGASRLITLVSNLLQETTKAISVFVDVIPDNHNTIYTYNRLAAYAQGYKGRLYIFPIISAEHYFIRSVRELLTGGHYTEALVKCVEVRPWIGSSLLETEKDLTYATSFEKFCKLFLLKAVPNCMKTTPGDGTWKNEEYAAFYTEDCKAKDCPLACSLSLLEKATAYVRSYPVFPPLPVAALDVHDVPDSSLVQVNHSLCKMHALLTKRFFPEGVTEALIPLYTLSSEEYTRAYKKYKLRKYIGSELPTNLRRLKQYEQT